MHGGRSHVRECCEHAWQASAYLEPTWLGAHPGRGLTPADAGPRPRSQPHAARCHGGCVVLQKLRGVAYSSITSCVCEAVRRAHEARDGTSIHPCPRRSSSASRHGPRPWTSGRRCGPRGSRPSSGGLRRSSPRRRGWQRRARARQLRGTQSLDAGLPGGHDARCCVLGPDAGPHGSPRGAPGPAVAMAAAAARAEPQWRHGAAHHAVAPLRLDAL